MFTCEFNTLNESCENGEHMQDVGSVFPLAVAVKRIIDGLGLIRLFF